MAEAGELPGITGGVRGLEFAAGTEVAAAEKVGGGDYGGPHGSVLVGALRPGQIVVNPQVEAHQGLFYRWLGGKQPGDGFEELVRPEWLAQNTAGTEGRYLFGIGAGGKVKERDAVTNVSEHGWGVGDQQIHSHGVASQCLRWAPRIGRQNAEAVLR